MAQLVTSLSLDFGSDPWFVRLSPASSALPALEPA